MASNPDSFSSPTRNLTTLLALVWLFLITASAYFTISHEYGEVDRIAHARAQSLFNKDLAFRLWASGHGGVYVPTSARIPPNPYLHNIPERDLTTPSGRKLTLMNPAYMMRQMNEDFAEHTESITHITSLKPLRPENFPDPWEIKALQLFTEGEDEFAEHTYINGKPFLRYMKAMITQEGCLKCHGHQGYEVGDIRGGISVSVPLEELLAHYRQEKYAIFFWHTLIGIFGLILLFAGHRLLAKSTEKKDLAVSLLEKSEEKFRTVADFTYAWEYWNNPDGTLRYISPSVERITGYPAGRFTDEPQFVKSIVHADDLEKFQEHFDREHEDEAVEFDFRIITATGEVRWLRHVCQPVISADGRNLGRRASNYNITARKQAEEEREKVIGELKKALQQVKLLSGFLPICASCKKIRDDKGYWNQIESYIRDHSEAEFSHSICPACARKLYPEFIDNLDLK
ncbi:MAG: DUF3365 domain-containing protein [Proteobacteria bacterium]|nr:DUF3365 domain-containing protein [Pseudomonadota bacterium]MBU1738654.1 DUF3365 domain-containing protein [Pseudomonadota bacterium]